MGFFDSQSETETNAAETGQQTADESTALSLSNLTVNKGSRVDVKIQSTDFDAINRAFALGSEALEVGQAGTAGALQAVVSQSNASLDQIAEFSGAAIEKFTQASKSENLQQSDSLLKFAAVAVVAVVAAFTLPQVLKKI